MEIFAKKDNGLVIGYVYNKLFTKFIVFPPYALFSFVITAGYFTL